MGKQNANKREHAAKKTSQKPFRLYTMHSQKGGVGKTSLAIAIAALEHLHPDRKAKTLLLDADLTGTSLADALGQERKYNLLPQQWTPQHWTWFDEILLASPDEFLKWTEGRQPKRSSTPSPWKDPHQVATQSVSPKSHKKAFHYIPSNPDYDVVREIVPSLAQECHLHYYAERLHSLIRGAMQTGFKTVVLDLPPGMFGLSVAGLRVAADGLLERELGPPEAEEPPKISQPIIVTTTDAADYRAVFASTTVLELDLAKERGDPSATEDNSSKDQVPFRPRGALCFNKCFEKDVLSATGKPFRDIQSMLPTMLKGRKASQVQDEDLPRKWREALKSHRDRATQIGATGTVMPFVFGFQMPRIPAEVERFLRLPKETRYQSKMTEGTITDWINGVWTLIDQLWLEDHADGPSDLQ